jgi:hypothetical protein
MDAEGKHARRKRRKGTSDQQRVYCCRRFGIEEYFVITSQQTTVGNTRIADRLQRRCRNSIRRRLCDMSRGKLKGCTGRCACVYDMRKTR